LAAAAAPNALAVNAGSDVTEIDVYGVIGDYGLRAEDFKRVLDTVNTSLIIVNINSPGGDVFAGIAAYNLLIEHPSQVHVKVQGLAASAASLIAMAGDKIIMGDGAVLMIHNAWSIALGDNREMAKMARLLAKIDKELAGVYSQRSGIPVDDVKQMMDEETWLSASDAIEQNFADDTAPDTPKDRAGFDLSAFKHAPAALLKPKKQKRALARKSGNDRDATEFNDAISAIRDKMAAFAA